MGIANHEGIIQTIVLPVHQLSVPRVHSSLDPLILAVGDKVRSGPSI